MRSFGLDMQGKDYLLIVVGREVNLLISSEWEEEVWTPSHSVTYAAYARGVLGHVRWKCLIPLPSVASSYFLCLVHSHLEQKPALSYVIFFTTDSLSQPFQDKFPPSLETTLMKGSTVHCCRVRSELLILSITEVGVLRNGRPQKVNALYFIFILLNLSQDMFVWSMLTCSTDLTDGQCIAIRYLALICTLTCG